MGTRCSACVRELHDSLVQSVCAMRKKTPLTTMLELFAHFDLMAACIVGYEREILIVFPIHIVRTVRTLCGAFAVLIVNPRVNRVLVCHLLWTRYYVKGCEGTPMGTTGERYLRGRSECSLRPLARGSTWSDLRAGTKRVVPFLRHRRICT